jgi:hypothetical protein
VTEIAIPEDRGALAVPAAPGADVAVSPLVLWAFEAKQAAQIASSLARTSFVPASLRSKNPDAELARQEESNNITAAILAGMELGLKPMATMRSIDIVYGTPALRAHTMRGLVQSHGHEVDLVESTPTLCVMRGRRKGTENWQTVQWPIGRAQALGITTRDQWRKQPQTMLVARATGEVCRLIASDVLYAMPYAVEELEGSPNLAEGVVSAAPRVTAQEILRQSQPSAQVAQIAPAAVSEASPEGEFSAEFAPDGHEGPHNAWGYSAACVVCQAEQSEADREVSGDA